MILTKTLEDSDYDLIKDEVTELKDCFKVLTEKGVRIDIGHEHRYWEYAMALKALHLWYEKSKVETPTIVDVGSGLGLLGPTLSWSEEYHVVEFEPNFDECYTHREFCNKILESQNKPRMTLDYMNLIRTDLENTYDMVFCISVIEHVEDHIMFLDNLAKRVKPGGLLFMTTDIMGVPGPHHFDNLRKHNYSMGDWLALQSLLISNRFNYFGNMDNEYHGSFVFDYSFGSICMEKKI